MMINYTLPDNWLWGLLVAAILSIASLATRKIDLGGAFAGGLITFGMFLGSSWLGIAALTLFFVAGTLVSQWKKREKQQLQLAQENEGKRTIVNAVANGGVAGVCGLLAWWLPEYQRIFEVAMMASIASANSDTFSSELGNVYGKRYINILTLSADRRGLDGVISWEGLLAGVVGSLLVALLYVAHHSFGLFSFAVLICVAGILGNLSDSYLGATLQRKGVLDNHSVNALSTLIAALLGGCIAGLA